MSLQVDEQDKEFLKNATELKTANIKFWTETRNLIFKGIGYGFATILVVGIIFYIITSISTCNEERNKTTKETNRKINEENIKYKNDIAHAYGDCITKLSNDICYHMNSKCKERNLYEYTDGYKKGIQYFQWDEKWYSGEDLKLIQNNFEKCVKTIGIDKCNLVKIQTNDAICFE